MNTLLLLPGLFASDGGIERILRLYVRSVGELTTTNGRVYAVVLNDKKNDFSRLAPYSTPALAQPVGCGRNKLACVWHTVRLARRTQRIVCGHINLLCLAHFARRFSPGLEVWLVAHGIEVWRTFSTAERRALSAAERILCVSDYTRRQLAANCPNISEARLLVLPNALDPQFSVPPARPDKTEAGLILSVTRLDATEAYKGVDHLILAMPAIRAAVPNARLRIVGTGADRARLEKIAGELEGNAIEFTGRVSDEALRGHLAACHVFALPSRGEGFGLVYLEAMANGKPCLAANAGGAPEVVDSTCGALVTYGDVPALTRACIEALRRVWDPTKLRSRAADFSFEIFQRRLATVW